MKMMWKNLLLVITGALLILMSAINLADALPPTIDSSAPNETNIGIDWNGCFEFNGTDLGNDFKSSTINATYNNGTTESWNLTDTGNDCSGGAHGLPVNEFMVVVNIVPSDYTLIDFQWYEAWDTNDNSNGEFPLNPSMLYINQVDQCGNISLGSTATLTQDIYGNQSDGVCLRLMGSPEYLDCNYFDITGDNKTNTAGIESQAQLQQITECEVWDYYTGINTSSYASDYLQVTYTYINTTGIGIESRTDSDTPAPAGNNYCLIQEVNISTDRGTTTEHAGIYGRNFYYTNISDSTIYAGSSGIKLTSALQRYNKLTNLTIYGGSEYGIEVSGQTDDIEIYNNTIYGSGSGACFYSTGGGGTWTDEIKVNNSYCENTEQGFIGETANNIDWYFRTVEFEGVTIGVNVTADTDITAYDMVINASSEVVNNPNGFLRWWVCDRCNFTGDYNFSEEAGQNPIATYYSRLYFENASLTYEYFEIDNLTQIWFYNSTINETGMTALDEAHFYYYDLWFQANVTFEDNDSVAPDFNVTLFNSTDGKIDAGTTDSSGTITFYDILEWSYDASGYEYDTLHNFTAWDNVADVGYFDNNQTNTTEYGDQKIVLLSVSMLCEPSWYCTQYAGCEGGTDACLSVADSSSCGITFTGELSDYDNEGCSSGGGGGGGGDSEDVEDTVEEIIDILPFPSEIAGKLKEVTNKVGDYLRKEYKIWKWYFPLWLLLLILIILYYIYKKKGRGR